MKYECNACGYEFGEDDPTEYLECPKCKSTGDYLKNKTRARIQNLENYCNELESDLWKLRDRVKELEELVLYDDKGFNEDKIRIMLLEYMDGFIEEYVEKYYKK